jgi:hypothetical protein
MKMVIRTVPLFIALLLLSWIATPVSATDITPQFVAGNPSCTSLGYSLGLKVDPPTSGTYTFPGGGDTVTVTSNGVVFDWSSTLGIDAVIVKGGPNANVYVYDPPAESFGDTGLNSPINPNNGNPFGLSHIEFCYDLELQVSKDAHPSFTRTFTWEIEKTVTPATWDLFTGDSGTSAYTVSVDKTTTDSAWAVNGTITIHNPDPVNAATITDVADVISGIDEKDLELNCGVSFPHTLAAGGTLQCTYNASLPDASTRTNTATVTTSGKVNGGTGTAEVNFANATINEVGLSSITVDDTYTGDLGAFSDDGSTTYNRTFTCAADEGQHNNTATIVETQQSDSASVTVNCHELTVTKDATTSFQRTWTWTIEKTGDQTALKLSVGQSFLVNYTVVVNATEQDSAYAVSGNIAVNNPAPIPATLTSVADVISGFGAATVDCGVTFPYELAALGTLNCTYSASLPDATDRTNTAAATLQNHNYASDGTSTPSGTTDFTGSAAVKFSSSPSTEEDECITVSDDKYGDLGTVCANQLPKTFTYSLTVGPYTTCGEYTYVNTASFVTNDSGTNGSDSWTVNVDVPCANGCTLTLGYWKTHSEFGPAPYDDTWAQLPSGASTTFFLSSQTWYQVFWTAPAGNAYYNLAHQYMAAKLNMLNGASVPPEVQTAFDQATVLLGTYTPAQIAALKATNSIRKQFIALAGTLASYNEGSIGPGHCNEDRTSLQARTGEAATGTIYLPVIISANR